MPNILFIGTPHMGIYKDVIAQMQRQGYHVDFIAEPESKEDPDNVRGYKGIRKLFYKYFTSFEKKNKEFWIHKLAEGKYQKPYDILFVLDGQSIHPEVFSILIARNTHLYAVNYLFDTTSYVYHFEKNFRYFDKIYTFDAYESKKYGINFLPIYWVEGEHKAHTKFKVFGMGKIDMNRFRLFTFINNITTKLGYPTYIRLQIDRYRFFRIKYLIRKLLNCVILTPEAYFSELGTQQSLTPDEFRRKIIESEVVIDTAPANQDGLTARFMWALGAKRKIITTNASACNYAFYSPQQIFIVNTEQLSTIENEIISFITNPLVIPEEQISEINKYRIDNWVSQLLQQE